MGTSSFLGFVFPAPYLSPSSIVFVRTTGNDITGDGTFSNPFATPAIGARSLISGSVLDIGVGDFSESLPIELINLTNCIIRGAGHDLTKIRSTSFNIVGGGPFLFRDLSCQSPDNTSNIANIQSVDDQVVRFLRCGFVCKSSDVDLDPIKTVAVVANGSCLLSLMNCSFHLLTRRTADFVSFYPTSGSCEIVNCVVSGFRYGTHYDQYVGWAVVHSNNNCFWDVAKQIENIGFGLSSSVGDFNLDPQFIDPDHLNFKLNSISACIDSGFDLSEAADQGLPLSPSENWGWAGVAYDVGCDEVMVANTRKQISTYNMHFLLMIFAQELDLSSQDRDDVRSAKFISSASVQDLRDRFGSLFNVLKPSLFSEEQFRNLLHIAATMCSVAPAEGIINSIVELMFDVSPRIDHRHNRLSFHFNKGRVVGTTPVDVSIVVMERGVLVGVLPFRHWELPIAGRFYFDRKWWSIKEISNRVNIHSVPTPNCLVYCDGTPKTSALIQSGINASLVPGASSPFVRVSGLSGMTDSSVGRVLVLSGCSSAGNNGSFVISNFVDPTSVDIKNSAFVLPDNLSGSISWTEWSVTNNPVIKFSADPNLKYDSGIFPLGIIRRVSGIPVGYPEGRRLGKSIRLLSEKTHHNGYRIDIPTQRPADDRVAVFEQFVRDFSPAYQKVSYRFSDDTNFKQI